MVGCACGQSADGRRMGRYKRGVQRRRGSVGRRRSILHLCVGAFIGGPLDRRVCRCDAGDCHTTDNGGRYVARRKSKITAHRKVAGSIFRLHPVVVGGA